MAPATAKQKASARVVTINASHTIMLVNQPKNNVPSTTAAELPVVNTKNNAVSRCPI